MNIKVSVILPIYNVEKYLDDCLKSLLNQTLDEFEVIAINDGSKDNSYEILKGYKDKFKNITIINQENSGLSKSRNVGVLNASGEYVIFLDSDDMLEPKCLELLYNLAKENDLDLVTFDSLNFDELTGKENYKKTCRKNIYKKNVMSVDEYLIGSQKKCILVSTLHFYKTDIIKNNRLEFKNGILHEDEHFSIMSYQYIKKVGYVNKALYLRRCRPNSIMTGNRYNNNKSLESYKWVLKEYKNIKCKNKQNLELCKVIDKRGSLLLTNLIRYKNCSIDDIKILSKDLDIKINYTRLIANIILYKVKIK